jgi:hypothetical protein
MLELFFALLILYIVLRMLAALLGIPIGDDDYKKKQQAKKGKKAKPKITPFNSHPGPCQACGHNPMNRGSSRTVGGLGFRMFEWPSGGAVVVTWWHCPSCGSKAKYGMHTGAPQKGWMLLDRYIGGW